MKSLRNRSKENPQPQLCRNQEAEWKFFKGKMEKQMEICVNKHFFFIFHVSFNYRMIGIEENSNTT